MERETGTHPAILAVSFGTSHRDSLEKTICAMERAAAEAFPHYEVRRAFTSQMIIRRLKQCENLEIDSVEEALERAEADGIDRLIVQPTHLLDGWEYRKLKKMVEEKRGCFCQLALGMPLLSRERDMEMVIRAMVQELDEYDDGRTAMFLMGHGTDAASNRVYDRIQDKLWAGGYENYWIGTVEAYPDLRALMQKIALKGCYKRVILQPFMIVAGEHAKRDMAGKEADSWKSQLESAGYTVECRMQGLGQLAAIQNLYVSHIKETEQAVERNKAEKESIKERVRNDAEKKTVTNKKVFG